jgi:hypothetical protein
LVLPGKRALELADEPLLQVSDPGYGLRHLGSPTVAVQERSNRFLQRSIPEENRPICRGDYELIFISLTLMIKYYIQQYYNGILFKEEEKEKEKATCLKGEYKSNK